MRDRSWLNLKVLVPSKLEAWWVGCGTRVWQREARGGGGWVDGRVGSAAGGGEGQPPTLQGLFFHSDRQEAAQRSAF